MAIDPNFVEVNEVTDYWSFLMSVSSMTIKKPTADKNPTGQMRFNHKCSISFTLD